MSSRRLFTRKTKLDLNQPNLYVYMQETEIDAQFTFFFLIKKTPYGSLI